MGVGGSNGTPPRRIVAAIKQPTWNKNVLCIPDYINIRYSCDEKNVETAQLPGKTKNYN